LLAREWKSIAKQALNRVLWLEIAVLDQVPQVARKLIAVGLADELIPPQERGAASF
jgi:hypothetical protein